MDNEIKIAIIGLGYWGPNLLRNFSQTPGCRVAYGCDMNAMLLDKFAAQYHNVKFTQDYDEVLNGDVDAVAIATPVHTHFKLAKKALIAGKHVFLEKPMASSVAECEELTALAEMQGLILAIDHTFLFTGAVKKIKELIDAGELGDIHYFDSERINLGLLQKDINVIWDLAPHDISIMKHVFGDARPVSVLATGAKHVSRTVEEIAHVFINFDSGITGIIHVSWLSPVKIRKVLIGGSKKMVVYDDIEPSEKIRIYDRGVSINFEEETPQNPIYRSGDIHIPKLEDGEALRNETRHFIDCVNGRERPLADGRAGTEVVRILEACDRSIKEKREINL